MFVALVVAWTAVWGQVPGRAVPAAWVTFLQEGGTATNVLNLFGVYNHAGSVLYALLDQVSGPMPFVRLRHIVWANVWLWGVATVWAWVLAWGALGRWWAATVVAGTFGLCLHGVHMALSETAAPLSAVCVFWVVTCLVVHRRAAERTLRALALGAALMLAVLPGTMRSELLLWPVVLAAAALVDARLGVGGADRLWRSGLRGAFSALMSAPASVLFGFLAGLFVLFYGLLPLLGMHPIAAQAIAPVNGDVWALPWTMALVWPIGMVCLFLLGLVSTLRTPFQHGGLPILVIIWHAAYHAAAHNGAAPAEMYRYLGYLVAPAFLIALRGWPALVELAERRSWPDRWPRVALLVLALQWTGGGATSLPDYVDGFQAGVDDDRVGVARFLSQGDQQEEVRHLLGVMDRHGGCDVYAPVVVDGALRRGHTVTTPLDGFVHFHDGGWPRPIRLGGVLPTGVAVGGPTLLAAWTRQDLLDLVAATGTRGCARLYVGMDCALEPGGRCEHLMEGMTPVEEFQVMRTGYYVHAEHHEPLLLQVFDLGTPADAPR